MLINDWRYLFETPAQDSVYDWVRNNIKYDDWAIKFDGDETELVIKSPQPFPSYKTPTTETKENKTMPKLTITNYMFDDVQNSTILTWSDGTKTAAKCEDTDKFSLYVGFMICVAKKFMPNATTQANEWLVKKPKREAEAKAKVEADRAEAERIAAKKAESAKQWHLRKQAGMIAEAYKNQQEIDEIKRIAVERYNVPADFIKKFFD